MHPHELVNSRLKSRSTKPGIALQAALPASPKSPGAARRPVPLRASLVVTVCLLLAAVNVAAAAPGAVGANCTETVHDLPGPKLGGQVSAVIVNAADPDTRKVSAPDARPPVLTRVNALSGRSPIDTSP